MDAMKDTHSLRMLIGAQYRQEVSEARKRNDVVTYLPSLAAFAEKADGSGHLGRYSNHRP
eukprot:5115697-Amphidinium_carterae.1